MRSYPVVDTLIDMFCAWLVHARELAEVCQLDSAEFSHLAQDLGVSRDDLEALVRKGAHAADELPKMLDALGIDRKVLARTEPLVMRDMGYACAMCGEKRRCDRELETGDAAKNYRNFCGNAPVLDALKNGVH
jgi:uncharacterized protein YjiS (DUF1127 family)